MAKHVTITEEYSLPSKGLIYGKQFDPEIKLRSMTVEDEMKRLSPSNNPYKLMSEIIDDCLITKLPISAYDLCIGDYTYLLHKLRVATYGPTYNLQFTCPECGSIKKFSIDLDSLQVNKYDESIKDMMSVYLPKSDHTVGLRFQTPRDLDKVQREAKEMKEKFPEIKYDPTYLITLQSLIDTVDGEAVDLITIKETLKKLPMMDTNILSQAATKLNDKIGINQLVKVHCDNCGRDVEVPFLYTGEFFRPTIY